MFQLQQGHKGANFGRYALKLLILCNDSSRLDHPIMEFVIDTQLSLRRDGSLTSCFVFVSFASFARYAANLLIC